MSTPDGQVALRNLPPPAEGENGCSDVHENETRGLLPSQIPNAAPTNLSGCPKIDRHSGGENCTAKAALKYNRSASRTPTYGLEQYDAADFFGLSEFDPVL